MNAFERWWNDVDLCCTDGKDDGHISFGEKVEYFGKGIGNIVKGLIKNPIKSIASIAGITALTIATGGAALPFIVGAGLVMGTAQVGIGVYKAATAKTDAEAKQAFEGIGTGTGVLGLSALGVKSANKAAANAGVKSLQGMENASWGENVLAMFKTMPQSIKQSGLNIKGNSLTWFSAIKGDKVLYKNSNALRKYGTPEAYMSKANDVQAYRFNPNGTEEEILANNPGVFAKDGKYYLPNKWSPEQPYLIDPTKEQMIMLYGGDDMAVCDGGVFRTSYVEQATFKADGTLNYVDPATQTYGKVINVTKQAPGSFQVAPEGTKVMTLEGVRTVKVGEVIAYDAQGNPYAVSVSNILKRNTGLSDNALAQLFKVDPVAVAKTDAGAEYLISQYYSKYYANPSENACKVFLDRFGIKMSIEHDKYDHWIDYSTADGRSGIYETVLNHRGDKDFIIAVANGEIK